MKEVILGFHYPFLHQEGERHYAKDIPFLPYPAY